MGLFDSKDEIPYRKKEQKAIWDWLKAHDRWMKEANKLFHTLFSNKRVVQLEKNQQALYNHISSLETTIKAMKKRDEEFAKMFAAMAAVSTKAVEEEGG